MTIIKKRGIAIALSIICVILISSAYSTLKVIKVVGANSEVTWSKSKTSRLLQYCSPSLGLPDDLVFQSSPGQPQQFVQALGQMPKTLRSATISIGNDPIALQVLDKIIENKGLSELGVHGSSISDDSLIKITELPNLRYLAISGNAQSFHKFSPRSQVEALELDKTQLDMEGLNRVLSVRTLQELSIVGNALDFDSLVATNWKHPSLIFLSLGYIDEVTPDQINLLVDTIKKGCPKIQAIYVNNRNVAQ